MLLLSSADFFFKIKVFKKSFRNTIRVSNGLDPDLDRPFVGPDLGIFTFLTACWVIFHFLLLSPDDFFSKIKVFKKSFRNTIRVPNSVDPDEDRHSVGPHLGSKLFANVISRRQKSPLMVIGYFVLIEYIQLFNGFDFGCVLRTSMTLVSVCAYTG